ncbi:MAG: DUF2167 domain-containing protein [Planctomycetes bacterium]|nr:DUF2167 domain-containing protein [Planctomycetota bacterium]
MSKMRSFSSLVATVLVAGILLPAQQGELSSQESQEPKPATGAAGQDPEPEAPVDLATAFAQFHPKTGTIELKSHGKVALGEGWLWLAGSDGQRFLVVLGNRQDPDVNGVAISPDYNESGIFAVYSHSEEGHVDDEEPDYDDLLQSMRDGEEDDNKARKKAGVATVRTLGWAEPPHYDKVGHKIYWATKLQFEGNEGPTLNYNVRVLGRTSTIDMIGVGDIDQLPEVSERCKELLAVTEFVDGKRYTDFDPEYDKVAAYGIGGLIAGKVALKVGLFAKLGLFLAKGWKIVLIALAAIGGLIAKLFGGGKKPARQPRVARAPAAGRAIADKADEQD